MEKNSLRISVIEFKEDRELFNFSDFAEIKKIFPSQISASEIITINHDLYLIKEISVPIGYLDEGSYVTVNVYVEHLGKDSDCD